MQLLLDAIDKASRLHARETLLTVARTGPTDSA